MQIRITQKLKKMDKTRLNALLDSVYELEGLIHLALNRDDIPETLERLIARKGRTVADATMFATEVSGNDVAVSEVAPPGAAPEILAPFGEAVPAEGNEGEAASEESYFSSEERKESVVVSGTDEIIDAPDSSETMIVKEDAVVVSPDSVGVSTDSVVVNPGEGVKDSLSKVQLSEEDSPVLEMLSLEQPVSDFPEVADNEPLKMSAKPRGRLVFTLNDRFRFKRELFGNSDEVFNKTLSNVAMFDSYEEAENYFLSDLQWNAERGEVKEFLDILRKYYK